MLSGVAGCESQAGSREGHQNMQEFEFVFWHRHGWKKSPHSMAGCLTRTQTVRGRLQAVIQPHSRQHTCAPPHHMMGDWLSPSAVSACSE